MTTRRDFLALVGMAGAWPALTRADSSARPPTLDRSAVDAELRRRAERQLGQTRLVVDYYRIRRKLAYPLALPRLILPEVPVPGLPRYPWATWYAWTLEERLLSLGWAGQWFDDPAALATAARELAALARWPAYCQTSRPNLSSAHAARILWTATTRWQWPAADLRAALRQACARLVEESLPDSDKLLGSIRDKADVLKRPSAHGLLHNIGLIGTAGLALAAKAAGHPAASRLDDRLRALFGAVLELRLQGFSEAVAYDGYVLDFVADWLATLPPPERRTLLDAPTLEHYLDESYMLSAPGNAEQVAELADVEPREMPFHLSAQAKLLSLRPNPIRTWHLGRCGLDVLRADALAALRLADPLPAAAAPPAGALDAHYAAVLRSGWDSSDLAVAVSCSDSPMGHLPPDAGSLVLGTRGAWLVADPGYQQYAKGDEREFTLGPAAHNAPVLNGLATSFKRPRRLDLAQKSPGRSHLAIDLTACYAPALALASALRHVWLLGRELVVVADRWQTSSPLRVEYHWHGHPDAAWWFEPGGALLAFDGLQLRISSPDAAISETNLIRLPGSRAQLSLHALLDPAGPAAWWLFALGADFPTATLSADRRRLQVGANSFDIDAP